MAPPPKVWPVGLVPDAESESPPASAPAGELAPVEAPELSDPIDELLLEPKTEPPLPEEPNPFPTGIAPAMPLPPMGAVPGNGEPATMRGSPKKPMVSGVWFCPSWIGFQSSLPVVGSRYRVLRNLISLVFTDVTLFSRAFTAPNWGGLHHSSSSKRHSNSGSDLVTIRCRLDFRFRKDRCIEFRVQFDIVDGNPLHPNGRTADTRPRLCQLQDSCL